MPADSLESIFQIDRVDQSELEQLLLSHFGGATGESPAEIQYERIGASGPKLTLRYSKDGELRQVEAGPTLSPDDIKEISGKIDRLLLTPAAPHIGQLVLFAVLPTTGWFRYKDVFQLVPIPAEAPRPRFAIGDHPLLLQYRVHGSEDLQISTLRRTLLGRELELLCAALTASIRGAISAVAQHHWSLVGSEDPTTWHSEYCQEAYIWPGANGIAAEYSPTDGLAPIPRTPASRYYPRLGISPGTPLDLPDVLEQLLDAFFAASRDNRDRFLRAAHWFQYARRVANVSRSGAYTALVSAVEALMGDVTPESICPDCRRPLGTGPTKRFIDFVEQYAPATGVTAKDRRKLYSLRSALSHGGTLLHSDRYVWGGMTSASLSEYDDQRAMWLLVRVVLVNWLAAVGTRR